MNDLITEARELCADAQLEAALLELKTMSGWLNKVVYHKLGMRWSFDNNNLIHWIVVFMRLLPELCDALEKANAEIARMMDEYNALSAQYHESVAEKVKLEAEIDRLREAQRWVPVSERLPKTEKPVQVYMPKLYMSVQTGFYTKYYGEDDGEWYEHWVASGDVTHWRPLPAPPEK
jgi:uncharacterized protein YdcH (DUF465 family)